MLNRLISLVFLLSFLKISIVYSETDFLLPQKKPSIFKKSEKQIQESINKNLPAPKPLLEKKGETKPTVVEQKKEPAKKKEIKTELKEEVKIQVSSTFVYPRKKPITYKVSSKEIESSKVLNNKDYDGVPTQIKRWNKSNGEVLEGLVKRREAEALLLENKTWENV